MNIFVTSVCPARCAVHLDDKRVVKMVLETTQMLCTAINLHGGTSPYKSTHQNHPSNVWARKTRTNWKWLHEHGMALCQEYTSRYGKTHKCQEILVKIYKNQHLIPDGPLTEFANCAAHKGLGLDYKNVSPVTKAYTEYLNKRWETDKRTPKWSRRE